MIRVINICSLIGLFVPEDQGCKAEITTIYISFSITELQLRLVYFSNRLLIALDR